ncbi:hypothetical protein GGI21_002382, partial [Coemansia aciculifera]
MRLFRKSKAAQEAAGTNASEQLAANQPPSTENLPLPPPLPPPPVLQLDFELPSTPPSNPNLYGSATIASGDNAQGYQQQQQMGVSADVSTLSHGFGAATNMGSQVGGSLMSSDMQRIAAAYSFDYPFQMAEDPQQSPTEEDTIQRQLAEQFGHGPKAHRPAPQQPLLSAPQSTASQIASKPLQSQPPSQMHQQLARVVMQNMQMATANRANYSLTAINQMPMSHGSNGSSSASSEEECGVPKLSSSMSAMNLSGGAVPAEAAAGGKISDRALYIQRAREASALGKSVAFSKPATHSASSTGAGAGDDDDDDDLVPLGGLRKTHAPMSDNNVPQTSMVSQQQHVAPHGHAFPSPVAYDSAAGAAKQFAPHQHALSMQNLHQQQQPYHYQQAMHSPSAASVSSQMSAPVVMRGAIQPQPGPPPGIVQSHHNGYPGGPAQHMVYPRGNAVAGGMGSMYSNVGYSRAQVMPPDHAYTPSPLGQVPIYGQPAMVNYQQQHQQQQQLPPPAMMNQQMYPQRVPQYQPPPQQQLAPPQQFMQQHQQLLVPQATLPQQPPAVQQAALASFIPSQLACRGSLAKNPLMRDINKLKSFSAKDYTARPTLLAEVDSRQLAKKSMPGLGGTTSHSYQPAIPPTAQQQPQQPLPLPLEQQHIPFRAHEQADYRDQVDHYPRPDRYEVPYDQHRSRSCQNFAEDDDDYSSVSSRNSNRRYHDSKRAGGGGHKSRRPRRHDHAYDNDKSLVHRSRDSRQIPPPPSSHGRRALGRRPQRRHNSRYHEHYDYEERSEAYARDNYDDFDDEDDEEYDERYGDRYDRRPAGPGYHGRHDSQRRPRLADMYADRSRRDPRWTPPYHGRGRDDYHHGRPRFAHLDDPRDGDSIIIRTSRPPTGKGGSSDSESLLVLEHGKPRSQFGRILANLKRQAAPFAPMSPTAT